jgi:hypothetical protein
MEYGLAKKITVWRKRSRLEHMQTMNRTSRRIRGIFAWSGSELLSNIQDQKLKIKNIAVDVLLKGFPMIPLSRRSNLARRYL